MRTRRTDLDVQYSVGGTLAGSVEQFTFTDNATGQADNISLTVNNATGEWLGAREPTKGRMVKAKFTQKDWDAEGDNKTLDCGEFTLDGFSAAGFPSTATIGAVATPADTAINETQRTATWNKMAENTRRFTEHEKNNDTHEINRMRQEIMDFSNACQNHKKHTARQFAHIIALEPEYNALIDKWGIKNGEIDQEFEYIKQLDLLCKREGKYLPEVATEKKGA